MSTSKLDGHVDVMRTYFGMVRRWATLVKPVGKNDAVSVLEALSADEFPEQGVTEVRGPSGEMLWRVETVRLPGGQMQVRASGVPSVSGPALWEGPVWQPATEGPLPPSAG